MKTAWVVSWEWRQSQYVCRFYTNGIFSWEGLRTSIGYYISLKKGLILQSKLRWTLWKNCCHSMHDDDFFPPCFWWHSRVYTSNLLPMPMYDQSIVPSVTTPDLQLLSFVQRLKVCTIQKLHLLIQHSYTELQVTSTLQWSYLATGLLHCSKFCSSTAFVATELL